MGTKTFPSFPKISRPILTNRKFISKLSLPRVRCRKRNRIWSWIGRHLMRWRFCERLVIGETCMSSSTVSIRLWRMTTAWLTSHLAAWLSILNCLALASSLPFARPPPVSTQAWRSQMIIILSGPSNTIHTVQRVVWSSSSLSLTLCSNRGCALDRRSYTLLYHLGSILASSSWLCALMGN